MVGLLERLASCQHGFGRAVVPFLVLRDRLGPESCHKRSQREIARNIDTHSGTISGAVQAFLEHVQGFVSVL